MTTPTTLTALVASKDWKGLIDAMSGHTSHSDCSDLWSAAMTAHYGPVGVHESYYGPDGRPTTEAITAFPRVAEAMRDAEVRAARAAARLDKMPRRSWDRSMW